MLIDSNKTRQGNAAMASVLLLYYHLLSEGGITNDQTVYLDPDLFDPLEYAKVIVQEDNPDIDQSLLREGALVHLVCDLNDVTSEHEEDYLAHAFTGKVIDALKLNYSDNLYVKQLLDLVSLPLSSTYDFETYNQILNEIFQQYVVKRHAAIGSNAAP